MEHTGFQVPKVKTDISKSWSFVHMNMSLLPIAKPLPVYTSPSSYHRKKTHLGVKPRTPNSIPTDKTASISPRRQGEYNPYDISPPLSLRETLLKKREALFIDVSRSNEDSWDISSIDSERSVDGEVISTTLNPIRTSGEDEKGTVRVKRILQIQDEDRCKEGMMRVSPRSAKRRCLS